MKRARINLLFLISSKIYKPFKSNFSLGKKCSNYTSKHIVLHRFQLQFTSIYANTPLF